MLHEVDKFLKDNYDKIIYKTLQTNDINRKIVRKYTPSSLQQIPTPPKPSKYNKNK